MSNKKYFEIMIINMLVIIVDIEICIVEQDKDGMKLVKINKMYVLD